MASEAVLRRKLQRLDDQIAAARAERTLILRQLPRKGVGRPPEKLPAAMRWLSRYLTARGGEEFAIDLFEAARADGHAEKTIRRAGDKLGVRRDPPGGGRACTWSLPRVPIANGKVRR